MILEELQADDFLKFRRIRLSHLPAPGLIGIRGPNESGKTSLGEAITFALFGRTLRLPAKGRRGAIRWGAEKAQVRLTMRSDDGARYRLGREVDSAGGYSADLYRLDPGGAEQAMGRGPAAVDALVQELLGFDFEAFRYAFYLGQKEVDLLLRAAESGGALERMIGVHDLEVARSRAQAEHQELARRVQELGLRIQLQEELVEELTRDDAEVERARDEAQAQAEALAEVEARRQRHEAALEAASSADRATATLAGLIQRVELTGLARSLQGRAGLLDAAAERAAAAARSAAGAEEDALRLQREHRMFADSLSELEEFVRAKGAELTGTPEGEPPPRRAEGSAPGLTSETELLQKMLRDLEEKLVVDRAHLLELEGRGRRSRVSTGLAALLGPALALGLGDLRGLLVVPLAVMAFFMLRLQAARVEDSLGRIREAENEVLRLRDEISSVKKVGKACDRFLARNKAAMLEGLRTIGARSLLKMAERLEERFPQFWNAPETFLEGYGGVLQEAVGQRRQAHTRALEDARKAAAAASSTRGRVESLARLAGLDPSAAVTLEGGGEDLLAGLERDLEEGERMLLRVEARGAGELPQSKGAIEALFDAVDPERERGRPDCDGFSRILRGQPPTGLSRSDDPWPWVRRQVARAREALAGRDSQVAELSRSLEELRTEAARIRAGVEVLEARTEKLAQAPTQPEERVRQLVTLRQEHAVASEEAAVRAMLEECLGATAARLRARLLPQIAEYAARMLPRITGGKHAEVRISNHGEIQFFAPEAGEYVSIDALSGGARDQFLLALRLAFASAVVRARAPAGSSPFLFLDEPLASSDEERGKAFLELLEDRSDAFRQVFVVTHRHSGEGAYDRLLVLSPQEDVLEDQPEDPALSRTG